MTFFNRLLAVLFILFAGLQYNDPDPWIWVPIYLSAAYLCLSAAKGMPRTILMEIALIIYSSYALILVFDKNGVWSWLEDHNAESLVTTMKAEKPWIEETREFGGLLILMFTMGLNLWKNSNKVNKPRTTTDA